MKTILRETEKYLYEYLSKADYEQHEIDYRYEHSLRVANIGLKLAEMENANKKVVVIGCLLHDLGKFDTKINRDHGRISATVARTFLEKFDLSDKEIGDICYAIATHVDGESGYEYEDILEAKIVTDADNIDRYSSSKIKQSRIWELNDPIKSIKAKINTLEERIDQHKQFLEKGILQTPSGNQLFKEKLKLQIYFNTELLNDLKLTVLPEWKSS